MSPLINCACDGLESHRSLGNNIMPRQHLLSNTNKLLTVGCSSSSKAVHRAAAAACIRPLYCCCVLRHATRVGLHSKRFCEEDLLYSTCRPCDVAGQRQNCSNSDRRSFVLLGPHCPLLVQICCRLVVRAKRTGN